MTPICRLLKNKVEILAYLGNISDYTFRKYRKMGMPCRFEDGNWLAHTDNIDDFFKAYTRVRPPDGVDDGEAGGQ